MNERQEPMVSVLTPVYNMGQFLPDCIESVLRQSYKNFEYIIVNNCSTDQTLEIALAHAKKDTRIKVHNNTEFVGVIANHNIAFGLISPNSKYCKVVSADDWIFPDCLAQMVALAEANPSVGIVGSYQISGSSVRWQGFAHPQTVFPGRDVCRKIFLDDEPTFGFGSPSSLLYRADLIRDGDAFYPNPCPHSDTSACFESLKNSDFGFVYQILAGETTHAETQSSKSEKLNRYFPSFLSDLINYSPFYLSKEECNQVLKKQLDRYHRFLAVNLLAFRGNEFWQYHKGRLEELGHPLKTSMLLKGAATAAFREIRNLAIAMRKYSRRVFAKSVSFSHPG